MRSKVGENLELVSGEETVLSILASTNRELRRSGAVLIVNSQSQKLEGVFTDGDLRRLLAFKGKNILDKKIKDLMTKNPRSLNQNAFVREAVDLVRNYRVDEVPILDDESRPIGLLDVQDLVAMRLIDLDIDKGYK